MRLRRLLIVTHRWLGIPMSLVFIVWFASGIVMMYAGGMPELGEKQRIERLEPLDVSRVHLSPAEAAARAGVSRAGPGDAALRMVVGRPAYRFGRGAFTTTVFADDGALLDPLDPMQSRAVAAAFLELPEERVHFVTTVTEPDQWTLVQARELPLHKFAADDPSGTEVYVSPYRAEVTMATTRGTRLVAWLGAIPHWFYFTPLRVNQPMWYWTVVIASALGCILALLGLALGVVQFRRSKPFSLSASIRYRGWMRWHYILGLLFGVFVVTWVFSGMMSMEPFEWTRAQGVTVRNDVLTGGPLELADFPAPERLPWADLLGGDRLKQIELLRIQGEPYYLALYTEGPAPLGTRQERLHEPYRITGRNEASRVLVAAKTMHPRTALFDTESIVTRLSGALPPGVHVADYQLLPEYDSYYYSRGGEAPLPVLRVRLDDPLETWIYVDPRLSRIVAHVHRLNRLERWLFNGLHSLDFSFWYDKRPLWDAGMILLSIGALVTSVIGFAFGFKRLTRSLTPFSAKKGV